VKLVRDTQGHEQQRDPAPHRTLAQETEQCLTGSARFLEPPLRPYSARMLRASSLALVVVISSCSAGVFDTNTDSSAALDAAANRNADANDDDDRDDDDDDRDEDDRDEDGRDDDDDDRDEDGDDDYGRDDDDDGRDDDTSDEDAVPAGDTDADDNDDFTRFILAGTDADAGADACAIGCDDSCTSCYATSLGEVCGAPVGRGEMCLSISDGVINFIDGPPTCPSTALPCAPGLDCHVVSFGYSVAGQCLPPTGHTDGEYCGADADCVDGLRCVAAGLNGGTCRG
jgi:hypothetical protein